jgi:uncharacterized Fe-S center protein
LKTSSELLFARYAPRNLEPVNSIGAKWLRLLDALDLASAVSGRRTCVKMHLGGGTGFSTIHPWLVRTLVGRVRAAGASHVFVTDSPGAVASAAERGYTAETVGCPLVPLSGSQDAFWRERPIDPPFRDLDSVRIGGEITDAGALIDLSHVKGHGACGFGGASKNLSMGCVTQETRRRLHALEGGLEWDAKRCDRCRKCEQNCPNEAVSFADDGRFDVFYHHCKYCQHCVLICPKKALALRGGQYRDFQRGMALATQAVLSGFPPPNRVYINVLTQITVFCDCWGMTMPSLVPDIGILAGRDIVAIEQASLDLIRTEDLIPGTLPPGWRLGKQGHLFERIHGKDPHAVIEFLAELGAGRRSYRLREIE